MVDMVQKVRREKGKGFDFRWEIRGLRVFPQCPGWPPPPRPSRGPPNPGTTALLALLPTAGELTALATNVPYPLLLTAVFTAGTGSSIFGVLWITALQHHIPTNTLGRVLALDALGNSALQPLGLTTTATLAAFILILTTLAVFPIPGIRTFVSPSPPKNDPQHPHTKNPHSHHPTPPTPITQKTNRTRIHVSKPGMSGRAWQKTCNLYGWSRVRYMTRPRKPQNNAIRYTKQTL